MFHTGTSGGESPKTVQENNLGGFLLGFVIVPLRVAGVVGLSAFMTKMVSWRLQTPHNNPFPAAFANPMLHARRLMDLSWEKYSTGKFVKSRKPRNRNNLLLPSPRHRRTTTTRIVRQSWISRIWRLLLPFLLPFLKKRR